MSIFLKAIIALVILIQSCLSFAISADESFNQQSPFLKLEKNHHVMQILNNGVASFAKRLELIDKAKKSIEVEYFIYNTDLAGKIFTQALIKKAQSGVKVRILVDASSVILQLDEYVAHELMKAGIEVRYYNTALTIRPKAILYRNHRKLLVVDDKYSIVGGRNIADEYFELSDRYNFLDRDVYTEGKIVISMRESFDEFWNDKIVDLPDWSKIKEPKVNPSPRDGQDDQARYRQWLKRTTEAKNFINNTEATKNMTAKIMELGQKILKTEPAGTCQELVFASDRPGTKNNRVLWNHLSSVINKTQKSITMDSPYFILQKEGQSYLSQLIQRGVDMTILTNSLFSTDAFYMIPAFKSRVKQHIQQGAKIYVYSGEALSDDHFLNDKIKESRWGIHAKTAVFDHDTIMIGTFNVDPRSKNLNTELALFCYDSKDLALSLESDIQRRINHSVALNSDAEPVDGRGTFYGVKLPVRIKYYLLAPLTQIFDELL